MNQREVAIEALARKRSAVVLVLCAVILVSYFSFILLIAFDKPLMGTILAPGLSIGILGGVIVIAIVWGITWAYTKWANGSFDRAVADCRRKDV